MSTEKKNEKWKIYSREDNFGECKVLHTTATQKL